MVIPAWKRKRKNAAEIKDDISSGSANPEITSLTAKKDREAAVIPIAAPRKDLGV
jgi:hypothetical protein